MPPGQLSPEQLKAAGYAPVPQQIQDYLTKNSTLPAQQATQGNLDIQKQQATLQPTINSAQAQSAVDTATVQPKIQSATADAVTAKNSQDKINELAQTGAYFESQKGKDNKVSPKDYNDQLAKYVALGGSSDEFNQKFADKYINPNNVWYDTPDNISVRKALPQIANVIQSYASLKDTGQNSQNLANTPFIGDYLKKSLFANNEAHNSALNALSGEILKVAGAGTGSTIRGTLPELTNVVGLLPGGYDSKAQANAKIAQLDNFLQKTYGTTYDEWIAQ